MELSRQHLGSPKEEVLMDGVVNYCCKFNKLTKKGKEKLLKNIGDKLVCNITNRKH